MQLTIDKLEDYCRLLNPGTSPDALADQVRAFKAAVGAGQRSFDDCFVTVVADGSVSAALSLVRIGESSFAITTPRVARSVREPTGVQVALVREALARANVLSATRVFLRVESDGSESRFARELGSLGFVMQQRRQEFRTPVGALPDEAGTPLCWTSMGVAGCSSMEEVAEILGRVAQGDPDWEPSEDPCDALKGFLGASELYCAPDCVQLARLGDQTVGLVIAQTDQTTGWARITYMGVVPAYRGRGLGRWLHRHGFAMLRAQLAVTYHGGTVDANSRMLALFRGHGCIHDRSVTEWLFSVAE